MTKIAIAGAGITGCIVALTCRVRGFDVDMYERTSWPGGVMRDIIADEVAYLNGCHYLEDGIAWFDALRTNPDWLDDGPNSEGVFQSFPHRYGSITDFGGVTRVHHDFAQPCFPGSLPKLGAHPVKSESVADRLQVFPSDIRGLLQSWAGGFGDLATLDASCAEAMQMGRIFFPDDAQNVQKAKSVNELADCALGVPREIRAPGQQLGIARLPKDGYDPFFERLINHLKGMGVRLHLGQPIAPLRAKDGSLALTTGSKPLAADFTIWCCNPTALLIAAGVGQLNTPPSRMVCVVGEFVDADFDVPAYYHVFSDRNSLVRIFFYDPDEPKLVVEAFDTGQSQTSLEAEVNETLQQLGFVGHMVIKGLQRQKRYAFFSHEDKLKMEQFEKIAPELNIIPGQWQHYSRDVKIENIIAALPTATAGLGGTV